jgi:hypothetical protein
MSMIRQWYNSDAFYLSSFLTFAKFWNVIDCIISFNNPNDTRAFHNISDETVMEQWCNSDRTVMPLIWALLCHFQAFEMSLMIFYPFAMHLKCDYASAGDTRPFEKNSDLTVMRQWCNSDAFDLSSVVSFLRICDVIDHFLSFCNAFEVWLCICWLHKTYC